MSLVSSCQFLLNRLHLFRDDERLNHKIQNHFLLHVQPQYRLYVEKINRAYFSIVRLLVAMCHTSSLWQFCQMQETIDLPWIWLKPLYLCLVRLCVNLGAKSPLLHTLFHIWLHILLIPQQTLSVSLWSRVFEYDRTLQTDYLRFKRVMSLTDKNHFQDAVLSCAPITLLLPSTQSIFSSRCFIYWLLPVLIKCESGGFTVDEMENIKQGLIQIFAALPTLVSLENPGINNTNNTNNNTLHIKTQHLYDMLRDRRYIMSLRELVMELKSLQWNVQDTRILKSCLRNIVAYVRESLQYKRWEHDGLFGAFLSKSRMLNTLQRRVGSFEPEVSKWLHQITCLLNDLPI